MKLLSKVLAFVLIISCLQFPIASATTDFNSNTAPSVDVTIEEFVNNREYYRNLAKDGWIIFIDHGNAEANSVIDTLFPGVDTSNCLNASSKNRSIHIPTSYWNVATQGARKIVGESESDLLYSSVRFYGVTEYEVCITNYTTHQITFYTEGAKTDYICALGRGKTAYLDIDTISTAKDHAFYLCFEAPCDVEGYVGARS